MGYLFVCLAFGVYVSGCDYQWGGQATTFVLMDIIAQAEVPVLPGDDAETLAARVLEREHRFLVEIISKIADGEIPLG